MKRAAFWQFSGETVGRVRGADRGERADLRRVGRGSRQRDQLFQRRLFQRSQAEGFQVLPEQTNSRHFHPNCEKVLYLLAGCGRHSFEDDAVELRLGMTIHIPAGVTHNLTNTGSELLTCLIAFNSGHRETVFLG